MSGTGQNTKRPRNLAARMGRWSADHWKTATFGWLAMVVVAFGIGGMVGTKNPDPNTAGPGESGRVDRILHQGFKRPAAENVLIQSKTATAGTPAFDAAVNDVVGRVSREADVRNVRSPLAPGHEDQISKDRHSALVGFDIRGEIDKAPDKVDPVVDAVAAAQAAHTGFFIGEMGDASAPKAVMDQYGKDLGKAGTLSLPITLIILIVTFGALFAAGIPLLLALTAVFGTFGLVAVASHVLPMANETMPLVLLIGLAVGVDYSMFYLRREREERAKGRSERAAIEAAAATSGRSVLISGLTVMVAMAGMFVTGDKAFASFGVATMMVVAVAMLGSLTVLPALLSRLGDRVDKVRVRRRRNNGGESRMWGWIVDRVLRKPALSAAIAGGLLLLLALPAIQMRLAEASPDTYPAHLEVVKTYKRMQQAFPGTALPANVIVKAANVNAPAVRSAIAELEQRALASGRAHEPITMAVNRAGTVANITIPIDGNGSDKASNRSLALLRHTLIPETVGALPDTEAGVTGLTAQWKDSSDQVRHALPLVVAFVLVFAFALMLVAFRSIVVALKAIVLNCLSVAAAYGILVLVFQHGFGKGLLGFTDTSGVAPVIPLLLFVILFGLSMDYHVFIVSRIRERFQRGATMDEAISDGIRSTGSVVTSAAIVMVCVFAVFATLSMLFFKQFGVGLAAAILIDATIVRGVLLPASMKLLGERNWYLPTWLEWLPRLEGADEAGGPQAGTIEPPKRRASTSSSCLVLSTSDGPAPPRRAVATEFGMFPRPRVECASVEQTIATPASRARRTCSSRRSIRSGRPLISTARPCSARRAKTASRSTAFGGRWLISRPVGWLRQLTYGDSRAVRTRFVSSSREPRWPPWTLACTQSSSASTSSGRSSAPSRRMSHSLPRRTRNGASSSFASAISSPWRRTSSAVRPVTAPTETVWSQIAR